jgi:hypothetical protein
MPFIPRLESLGFSGIAYKQISKTSKEKMHLMLTEEKRPL